MGRPGWLKAHLQGARGGSCGSPPALSSPSPTDPPLLAVGIVVVVVIVGIVVVGGGGGGGGGFIIGVIVVITVLVAIADVGVVDFWGGCHSKG